MAPQTGTAPADPRESLHLQGRIMSDAARCIAINTGGGDAPGLIAVIEAAHAAHARGWQLIGIREAYDGLRY
jgi:6-phosphofructokinase 1